MPQPEPIAVIGTGYVGLVTAAGFAELGSEVFCVDVDADKVARLQAGEVPIYEPGLQELVAATRDRLHFSTELAPAVERARLLFVAVGTPATYSGDADLSAVRSVVESLPDARERAVVMKSTVPCGTGVAIQRMLAERGRGAYEYVSCPEFLREGTALADFRHPDRVVVGDSGGWAGDAVEALYAPLDAPVVRTDLASAEMVKLASNAFLATKISFINEIANVCEETGADVIEVARGMGLDARISPSFLHAGLGYGGSCLTGSETVLARHHGRTTLLTFETLWKRLEAFGEAEEDGVIAPDALEVLSWVPGEPEPMFLPVMCVTRRAYDGDVLEVRTKMGRRVTCTPDHPWVVGDGAGGEPEVKLAEDLTAEDWIPLALGRAEPTDGAAAAALVGAADCARLSPDQVIVRPAREHVDAMARDALPVPRRYDVRRTGAMRLHEAAAAGVPLRGATFGTARNGNFVPGELPLDEAFWRVVGLYVAEGHTAVERERHRITWSFHPDREQHLVDEVVGFWLRHGVRALVGTPATSKTVSVSSRLLGAWWLQVLGLGRTSYEQRLPDLIWDRPEADKWALLSGLWEGDGSWSLVNGGPSAILELGTISDELADGVLRLLGDLGIVASRRIGRTAKSTKDTHWIRVSGAEQIERAIRLVPERDRAGVLTTIGLQSQRIAPTGYRRFGEGPAWVRVRGAARRPFEGHVYSVEVPGPHTFAATGGLISHNCFPKDVSALKQLAGNTGYHFQLLGAVIEVNELQKRRLVAKLQKHLGELVGKRVALLGLAFKPHTDDMREASSLVLAARLQAEGAHVSAYDPVAEAQARERMPGVDFADSALGAVADADAVVLVTEWPEFRELDWNAVREAMAGQLVVDGRNALEPEALRAAGLAYEGVGRR
ncbi:MAG TPA: nucleotide sugar dehydrogenase [Solirubrobacteraceae bacterium]|nr:nucleotide sugar dehydrogenase [Solirubrobacteraceae bacterium]